jgi:hypothetical protein
MRVFGVIFLVVLFAAAAMMYLQQQDATTSLQAVADVAANLREQGVYGTSLDREMASQMLGSMRALVNAPDQLTGHTEDLRTVAQTASEWARSAPAPSAELRAAVALRSAAGELRSYALEPSDRYLGNATRHLDDAEAALAGEETRNDPTGAVRDQIENLQRSHQEKLQEVQEELSR